jgi:hypothetical protein
MEVRIRKKARGRVEAAVCWSQWRGVWSASYQLRTDEDFSGNGVVAIIWHVNRVSCESERGGGGYVNVLSRDTKL